MVTAADDERVAGLHEIAHRDERPVERGGNGAALVDLEPELAGGIGGMDGVMERRFDGPLRQGDFLTNVTVATGRTLPLTTKCRVAARDVAFLGLVSRSGAL